MRIKTRLILANSVLALLAGSVAALGLAAVRHVDGVLTETQNEHLPTVKVLADLKLAGAQIVTDTDAYCLAVAETPRAPKGAKGPDGLPLVPYRFEEERQLAEYRLTDATAGLAQATRRATEALTASGDEPADVALAARIESASDRLRLSGASLVNELETGGTGFRVIDRRATFAGDVRSFLTVIEAADARTGNALAARVNRVHVATDAAWYALLIGGLCAVGLAAALGVATFRRIAHPIEALREASTRVAAGGYDTGVYLAPGDELGDLADAFNRMVTEVKESRDQLVADKTLADDIILRSMVDVLIVLGPDRKIAIVNDGATALLGYSQEELIGLPIETVFPGHKDLKVLGEDVLSASNAFADVETACATKDHRLIPVSLSCSVVRDGEGVRGVVCVAHDITRRLEAEDALRERDDRLRQAQKMEAVGQLAGGVAHDFNNVLMVIMGRCEAMLTHLGDEARLRRDADQILKAAERGSGVTNQLLAFSRRQVIKPEVLDLNSVVVETSEMLRDLISERVALATSLTGDLWAVEADRGRIGQVIMNLVINARDAMPDGGRVEVSTRNAPGPEAPGAKSSGDHVVIRVSDTGVGMAPEVRARAFEPFFTTKDVGKGTGLGLATVYGIVEQCGGSVSIESAPGAGTTFTVSLPRCVRTGAPHDERIAAFAG